MPKHDQPHPIPTPEQARQLRELPHRVQSAIAVVQETRYSAGLRHQETEGKHLRVGVNSALVETSAIARLLFRKGLITSQEYFDTLIEVWEEEVDRYRADVKRLNPKLEI